MSHIVLSSSSDLNAAGGFELSTNPTMNQPFFHFKIHNVQPPKLRISINSSFAVNFRLLGNSFQCSHQCHVPVAIGIQKATDGSLMHPTCFQRAADRSFMHPHLICFQKATDGSFMHPTCFQRATDDSESFMHRTEPAPRGRPTGCSCTHLLPESGRRALSSLPRCILATFSPPASKYRTPATSCTQKSS